MLELRSLCLLALPAAFTFGACTDDIARDLDTSPIPTDDAQESLEMAELEQAYLHRAPSAVYTLSNERDANRIVVFPRALDGTLQAGNAYITGGKGSANGLGSQGALVFDAATNRFFAVNAGDNSISMLRLRPDNSLIVRSRISAAGVRPISITFFGNLVYVVNAGDESTPANIAGFYVLGNTLYPIPGSSRPLSAAAPAPAQIQFTPDGSHLIVSEKATNKITTYRVQFGVAQAPQVHDSVGQTPFGFTFDGYGHLIVSEAFGGGAGLSATTSYSVAANGQLTPISSVPSGQSAACWVAVAADHAYVTNTASHNVTGYAIAADGMLTLDNPDGIAATSAMGPTDVDASDDGRHLYVLAARDDGLSGYAIADDGVLTRLPDLTGITANAVGLVAR